ncbi:ArsJ-associated glyceraldehyde-3-phosphate dehydrogenase [Pontivivens ytuae]|uniref:Glyceraldehyde-3-phosphate dehydrogenase n=1 Tax=Pontivivens ytuae TaxID=2789856 RepID=A0A7S9LTH3_9RHOB|nr:ArsJ-associated glyceraldehyde-3-phosphate dehydrogenase [Pontivivens ytuae]QPH54898.1 ArsJ-associated glyceraldehyde-3-phosphate dehydrogenase [Pontivivens ytuae]
MKIGLNGLGRIGKLALRRMIDEGMGARIAWVNDVTGDAAMHAHLLEFDTVHGRWGQDVGAEGDRLRVGELSIPVLNNADPADLPLGEVDLVVECTGKFKTLEALAPYRGKKVAVSAPIKQEGALDLVYGINHDLYDTAVHDVVSAASCTTNCLAPVVKVLHEAVGIRHGSITTIHDVTNTQVIVDKPMKDLRRARSALNALIPTTTGSATAITVIYPELKGRLNGHAVRVPLLNASLTDCVFEMERTVTEEEINRLFEAAEEGPLAGILGVERRPLVSTDFLNDPRSAIIDAPSTMVVNGTQAKIYAWYDNEWGYTCRLVDIVRMMVG